MEPTMLILLMMVITCIILVLTFFIIIRIYMKSTESKTYIIPNERIKDEDMLCPICQNLMTAGYTMSPRGIYFHPKGTKLNMLKATETNGTLKHTFDLSFRLKQRETLAWHCPHCKIVTIDHSHFLE